MPINYQALEQHCRDANLLEIKRELLGNGDEQSLQATELRRIADIVTELKEGETEQEKIESYQEVLEILIKKRIPLIQHGAIASREKLYAYLSPQLAKREEDAFQRQVSNRFWRVNKPLKEMSQSYELHALITQELVKPEAHRVAILLDGYSSRSLILAMVKIITANTGYPFLKFRIGTSVICCDPASSEDGVESQRANHWVKVEQLMGERFTYGDWTSKGKQGVYNYLSELCGHIAQVNRGQRERQLAVCLKTKSHTIAPFTSADFNDYFNIRLPDETPFSLDRFRTEHQKSDAQKTLTEKIHYLNGLLFIYTECEVSRRLYRTHTGDISHYESHSEPVKPKESDRMPMGILQARSLDLLAQGIITLNDVFGHSTETYGKTQRSDWKKYPNGSWAPKAGDALHRALFGVATGKSTISHLEVMKGKADTVNSTSEVSLTRTARSRSFFAGIDPSITSVSLPIKEGHNRLKITLGGHFGGVDDGNSSGEDYSDDEVAGLGQGVAQVTLS